MLEKAKVASEKSYSPYSNFKVGAVLETKSGNVYTGTNIENAAYFSCCAERLAFYKAIENGEREFKSITVYGSENPCYPCGTCRQLMNEFCDDDFLIITTDGSKTLSELLPNGFKHD